jgi:phosphonate transport system permease protein
MSTSSSSQNSNGLMKGLFFDGFIFSFFALVTLTLAVQPNEEQMLRLGLNSLIYLGLFIAGSAVAFFLKKIKVHTLGQQLFEPAYLRASQEEKPLLKSFWGWQLLTFLFVTFVVGLVKTKFSIYEITDEDGFAGAVRLFQGMLNPNFDILPRAVLNVIETIFMAFIATILAIPFAFILSFLCAKNIMNGPFAFPIYLALRTLLNLIRSIEALVWAIIFSVWVGIGPFAGMLALMIHSIASLAKQYSEMVETVNEGPIEGIASTGATQLQVIWFAIVPQVILPYISFTVYRWDINVRMATIIGLVGGGGIGTMLILYQGQAMWSEVGCIILVIASVVWAMDQASALIREALK